MEQVSKTHALESVRAIRHGEDVEWHTAKACQYIESTPAPGEMETAMVSALIPWWSLAADIDDADEWKRVARAAGTMMQTLGILGYYREARNIETLKAVALERGHSS
ncbi:hypothetical protein [Thioalkalivibrio sp. ALE19]|uniref:hypothetical protein n=1 Tax=Thioalkalivibrio sp. ALE19 TaxID=1266909 RepID=UPI0004209BA7|nr:hypothetical protein [Thioalkalivibrio sp. ALE19]